MLDSGRKGAQGRKVRERVWEVQSRRMFCIAWGIALERGIVAADGSDEDDGEGEEHEEQQGGCF